MTKSLHTLAIVFLCIVLPLPGHADQTVNSPIEVIVDNNDDGFVSFGTWEESNAIDEFAGSSLYTTSGTALFTPKLLVPGFYEVFGWWSAEKKMESMIDRKKATFQIAHADGSDTIVRDQNLAHGEWVSLGKFKFNADNTEQVLLSHQSGILVADAIRFQPLRKLRDVASRA